MQNDDRSTVSRRSLLKATATLLGASAAGALSVPALARGTKTIKFTLPWLAQGATAYAYVADDQGMFARHGIKAQISRGFGSLAAAQTIGSGKFDFGLVSTSSTIVSAAANIPLVALGTTNYDAYMGVLLRDDSPIHTPKDLEGKKIGAVPASTEFPLWHAFAQRSGFDPAKVTIVQADPRVLERMLVEKQVDAAFSITSTSYAVAKIMGADTRAMLWSRYGLPFYSNNIVTRPEILQKDPELCQGVTEALLEGLAFCLRDPEKALDIFMKKVPELKLTAGGEEFARLSQGFMLASVPGEEAQGHGLGYTDLKKAAAMVDLIDRYASQKSQKKPDPDTLFTNRFAGKIKLTDKEWAQVEAYAKPFTKIFA